MRGWIVAEERISLKYDGPAVAEHRMRVRDLAPSLLATADLFHDAQQLLYPDEPPLDVEITTRDEGSFLVELLVEVTGGALAVQQAMNATGTAAEKLRTLVDAARQLFELIRHGRGQQPTSTVDNGDGTTTLNFEHADNITVNSHVFHLYSDGAARRDAREVVQPLRREGYEAIRLEHDGHTVELNRSDYDEAFDRDDFDSRTDEVSVNTGETIVRIVAPAFDNRSWRLDDGDHIFPAAMLDNDFMDRVRRRAETFAAGDTLRVRMRTVQTVDGDGGLHVRREVTDVLAHVPAGIDQPFPGLGPGDTPG